MIGNNSALRFIFRYLRIGLGWGSIIASGLNSWALAFQLKPVQDVFSQGSLLARAVVEYRSAWQPIIQFCENLFSVDIGNVTTDWLTFSLMIIFAAGFKGNSTSATNVLLAFIFSMMVIFPFAIYSFTFVNFVYLVIITGVMSLLSLLFFPFIIYAFGSRDKDIISSLKIGTRLLFQILGAIIAIGGLSFGLEAFT